MNSRKRRCYGRQIPADILIGSEFALSLLCGFPIALFLKRNCPQINDYLRMFLAAIGGFIILLTIIFALSALAWLLDDLRRKR